MNKKILANIFLLLAVAFWGISFVSTKICLDVFQPMSLAFYRFLIGSTFLFLILRYLKENLKFDKSDFIYFLLTGVFGISLYFYFENTGIIYLSPSIASIIIGTIPVFIVIIETIFYKEIFTFQKLLSLSLSIIGLILVVDFNLKTIDKNDLYGYIMMFGAVLAFVVFSFATKPISRKYSNIKLTFYQSIFGTVTLLPFIFFENINMINFNNNLLIHFLFLSIICSALAYYFYLYAFKELGPSICALYINLSPVFTIIFEYIIFKNIINKKQIFGAILIILSVYIINLKAIKTLEKEKGVS
ncbi:MAG: DMT family transporter [Peptostreptococcaceae bacterium]|jgi:drug/metabolite transporter (DMT)-like permease|nr:DMT family transporter [Peptostreptococcaceae bacterium]